MSNLDEMLEREFKEKCKNHLLGKRDKELSDLRDHFAGLAMQQLLLGSRDLDKLAVRAYEVADAMLKQRSLTND